MNTPNRTPTRVRHALKFRQLSVVHKQQLTPHMVRITLGGPDLAGFTSPGFDDHVRVFFPDPATGELILSGGAEDGPRPTMRDYTPRHFDPQAQTLAIDFALHDAGAATTWAAQAQVGQTLGVGGPRGSFILPTEFDGHLLIGDDTALPAIARRLGELPAGVPALVLIEVDSPADEQALASAAQATVVWVHRPGPGARRAAAAAGAFARPGPAARRHPRLGRLRNPDRQSPAGPPGGRAWREATVDQGRRLLAPGQRGHARPH